MFEIKRYSPEDKNVWNQFVANSKNGTFLLDRDFMDYHSEKFEDFSLMVYRKGALYAVLPGNRVEGTLFSHQGLTYGGLITSKKATASEVVTVFELLKEYLKSEGFSRLVYKPTPHIYHTIPAEEDLYALYRLGARQTARYISSSIYQDHKIKFTESRRSGLRKAKSNGLVVRESEDINAFWQILNDNLSHKYGVHAVHSLAEIQLLKSRFPQKIRLYMVYDQNEVALAGTLIFLANEKVLHVQYISGSPEGKEKGALDLLFDDLINSRYTDVPVIDFGHSTENQGMYLNEALIFQKEGFGGRGVMYDVYELDL